MAISFICYIEKSYNMYITLSLCFLSVSAWCFLISSSAASLTCLSNCGISVSDLFCSRILDSRLTIVVVDVSKRCFKSLNCCLRMLLSNSAFLA